MSPERVSTSDIAAAGERPARPAPERTEVRDRRLREGDRVEPGPRDTDEPHAAPESFAEERKHLESQWERSDQVSTEDLRQAMRRYRSFFERLLAV